ncbi:MAG TPA: MAPEG family protein [Caulobacteraceae bacterium]
MAAPLDAGSARPAPETIAAASAAAENIDGARPVILSSYLRRPITPRRKPMTMEIQLLAWSVVLLIAHIAVQGALVAQLRGAVWNAGPRDEGQPPLGKYPGRAQRALENFKETYPAFIALALALAVTARTGGAGTLGAWIWFAARVVYLPLYLLGVPWLRSIAYGVSFVGLIMMLTRLL